MIYLAFVLAQTLVIKATRLLVFKVGYARYRMYIGAYHMVSILLILQTFYHILVTNPLTTLTMGTLSTPLFQFTRLSILGTAVVLQ